MDILVLNMEKRNFESKNMKKNKNTSESIDVRILEPVERHKKLLALFRDLAVDDHFIFINDHDPIPLYYEIKSLNGDVVGWEYLKKGGRNWEVKVTRLGDSEIEEIHDADTLIDLAKTDEDKWKQVVFHRFGMMREGELLQLNSKQDPSEIRELFEAKLEGEYIWKYLRETPGDYRIHIKKTEVTGMNPTGYSLVDNLDLRPHEPAKRHELFYQAFVDLAPNEAFEFFNDHDPKPLYYQMEAESEEPFNWEYLEEGPEVWKVRVIKLERNNS